MAPTGFEAFHTIDYRLARGALWGAGGNALKSWRFVFMYCLWPRDRAMRDHLSERPRMIPKSGNRFSDKIMRKKSV